MNAIHIIMATSTSANPHNSPNERIENIIRKRKISAMTFLIFGILLIIAGSLLASFEGERFSISFIIFGAIGIIFAFMYWISAERISIALRKYNAYRMRQIQLQSQNRDGERSINSISIGLPSYEQSVLPHIEIPPSYDEVIKTKTIDLVDNQTSSSSIPIHSISLSIDQATDSTTIPNRK